MRVLGNILWIILGGLAIAIGWALVGLILCISIIGIPFGLQAFKMAGLTLTPFGKTVQYGGGVGSALANILWVVNSSIPLQRSHHGIRTPTRVCVHDSSNEPYPPLDGRLQYHDAMR